MEPSLGLAWVTAVVGFVAAVPLWRFTKWTIVVTHEGGHALFGALFGQKVSSIKLSAAGGVTQFPPTMPWFADLLITLAGYLGPSAVGLGGVYLLLRGRPEAVLWISMGLMVLLLLKVRNPLAFLTVIATGGVLYWVARHWEDPAQLAFGYAWVWFLLMGATRNITDLFWVTHAGDSGSDAAVLQRLTWLPDIFWLAVFWLATMSALLYGGALMLRQPT
jgi:hypothetical protein